MIWRIIIVGVIGISACEFANVELVLEHFSILFYIMNRGGTCCTALVEEESIRMRRR